MLERVDGAAERQSGSWPTRRTSCAARSPGSAPSSRSTSPIRTGRPAGDPRQCPRGDGRPPAARRGPAPRRPRRRGTPAAGRARGGRPRRPRPRRGPAPARPTSGCGWTCTAYGRRSCAGDPRPARSRSSATWPTTPSATRRRRQLSLAERDGRGRARGRTTTGPGSLEAERERIFERFAALDDARHGGAGGTGPRPRDRPGHRRAHGGTLELDGDAIWRALRAHPPRCSTEVRRGGELVAEVGEGLDPLVGLVGALEHPLAFDDEGGDGVDAVAVRLLALGAHELGLVLGRRAARRRPSRSSPTSAARSASTEWSATSRPSVKYARSSALLQGSLGDRRRAVCSAQARSDGRRRCWRVACRPTGSRCPARPPRRSSRAWAACTRLRSPNFRSR